MSRFPSLIGGAVLALSAVITIGSANAQDVLRVGTEGAYPPYNFTNSAGELEGFEIDLANELCSRIDRTCEFVAQDWDGIIPALQNGRYDVIMAGMSITDERREQIAFTEGYVTTPAWFVAPSDSELQSAGTFEEVKAALDGKTVGVQVSTIHQAFLEQEMPDAELELYDTQELVNLDLAAGRVDAGLADSSSWDAFLKAEGNRYKQFGPGLTGEDFAVFGEGVGIGLRKEDEELRNALNAALDEMRIDGSLAALAEKWFGYDISMS